MKNFICSVRLSCAKSNMGIIGICCLILGLRNNYDKFYF